MDAQSIFNTISTICGILIGWIIRVIWFEIKLMQRNQRDIERDLSENFVRKEDYRIDVAELKGLLSRMFDRLDRMADTK